MEHVFWCIGHHLVIPDIVRAEGCNLFDSGGRKYTDFESGVWCTPLGHSHPAVNRAMKEQSDKISHTGYCYASPVTGEAAKEVLSIAGLSQGKCVFLSSGSEAVEFGVQVLRKITEKPLLLTLHDSFLGSYGSAGKRKEDEWYLLNWSACSTCSQSETCNPQCKIFSDIPFDKIGGFVFEPGSSSGLVKFPPTAFVQNLVSAIKREGGFIQVNEITTGIGRTGEWFGFQHYKIQPDVVSMGKGLGNGYPISAIALSAAITEKLLTTSFYYSQSHQNDPLGCAVAKAVISVIREEDLLEKTRKVGMKLREELRQIAKRFSLIQEVRGRGLMIAVEFIQTNHNVTAAETVFQELLKRGFIVASRPGLNILRIDPPLTVKETEVDEFISSFTQILKKIIK